MMKQLELAQDDFAIAHSRMRALESIADELRRPLDLKQAHRLWTRILAFPLRPRQERIAGIEQELEIARMEFQLARDSLHSAQARAEAARLAA